MTAEAPAPALSPAAQAAGLRLGFPMPQGSRTRRAVPAGLAWVACLVLSACDRDYPPVAPPGREAATPAPAVVAATGPATVTFCNIEYLGDTAFEEAPLSLVAPRPLIGWLADEEGATPHAVELQLLGEDGEVAARVPLALGLPREDVARVFPDHRGLADSGFEQVLDPAALPPGRWHLVLRYATGASPGARVLRCDNGRRIMVGEP